MLQEFFSGGGNTLFGLYDMFVGGAFTRATVFALGIMPYISASIILQLMGAVVPFFQKLQREGEEGRRKINQYTRYGTVFLAAAQSLGVSYFLESIRGPGSGIDAVIEHRHWFPVDDDADDNCRNNFHHVAWRTDNRARHRQRNFADHFSSES